MPRTAVFMSASETVEMTTNCISVYGYAAIHGDKRAKQLYTVRSFQFYTKEAYRGECSMLPT